MLITYLMFNCPIIFLTYKRPNETEKILYKYSSYSLFKGIKESKYSYIATLDSDGQNPPKEIKKLIEF